MDGNPRFGVAMVIIAVVGNVVDAATSPIRRRPNPSPQATPILVSQDSCSLLLGTLTQAHTTDGGHGR
jgi:hypothetical protein